MATSDLFEIIGIRNAGDLSNERLILRTKQDVEIGAFLILTGKSSDAGFIPNKDNAYWFPDRTIPNGEYIRLYTKGGASTRTTGNFGDTPAVYNNFFWGKSDTIWNRETINSVAILKSTDWTSEKVL